MANLSVRKLDKNAYELLRARATKHGLSMEEEARQIIYKAVYAPESIVAIFQAHFGKLNGIDLDQELNKRRKKPHEPMDFNE